MPAQPWGCFYNGEPPTSGGESINIGFFAERGVNQTINAGLEIVIDLDTIIEESSPGVIDLVGNRFVCVTPGRYVFCLSLDIEFFATDGFGESRLYVNGTRRTDERDESTMFDYVKMGNSFCFQLSIGDIVQPRVYNGDFFNATLAGCQNQFSGALIATP